MSVCVCAFIPGDWCVWLQETEILLYGLLFKSLNRVVFLCSSIHSISHLYILPLKRKQKTNQIKLYNYQSRRRNNSMSCNTTRAREGGRVTWCILKVRNCTICLFYSVVSQCANTERASKALRKWQSIKVLHNFFLFEFCQEWRRRKKRNEGI